MPIQFSTAVRNARLDAIETTTGTTPVLRIRSGPAPANCAAARSGTVLATLALPSSWMADATGGTKAIAGTWQDLSCDATGTAGHFEIMDSGATTCHVQGTVTASGGGGDMEVSSISFTLGASFTVTAFTLTDGNA